MQHELLFYLIFAAGIYFKRLSLVISLWFVSLIAVSAIQVPQFVDSPIYEAVFAKINLEFLCGIAAAIGIQRRVSIDWRLLAFAALTISLAWGVQGGLRSESWILGVPLAILVFVLARSETDNRLGSFWVLTRLGDASYSIYLVHPPVIALTLRAMHVTNSPPALLIVACLVGSIVSGFAYYFLWELPMTKLLWSRGPTRAIS